MNYRGIAAQDRHYTPMMPPEALETDEFDRTFDIYQVGLTLYRMCNGNADFLGQLAKYGLQINSTETTFRFDLRNGKFPDRKSFAPHVPSTLRNVIRKCLETKPEDRYQTALDVANAMAGISGECLDCVSWNMPTVRSGQRAIDDTQYEFTFNEDGTTSCYKTVKWGKARRVADACRTKQRSRTEKDDFTDY